MINVYEISEDTYRVQTCKKNRRNGLGYLGDCFNKCSECKIDISFKDNRCFDIKFSDRKSPLFEVEIEEEYFKKYGYGEVDFRNNCFDRLINMASSYFFFEKYDSDEKQIRAFYFLICVFMLDSIRFVDNSTIRQKYILNSQPNIESNFEDNNFYNDISYMDCMGVYCNNGKARIVYLCLENIQRTYDYLLRRKLINDKQFKLTDLLVKVFAHEVGHNAYDNNLLNISPLCVEFGERCANYYSSVISRGYFDRLIYTLTLLQPSMYRDPLLVSMKFINKEYYLKEKEMWK